MDLGKECGKPSAYICIARGDLLMHHHEFSVARVDYALAIDLEPQNPLCYSRMAQAELRLGNFADAAHRFSQAIELDEDPALFLQRGHMYQFNREPQKAGSDYLMALHLYRELGSKPEHEWIWNQADTELRHLGLAHNVPK